MTSTQKILLLQVVAIVLLAGSYYLFKGVVFSQPVLAAGLFAAGMVIGTVVLWLDENWFVKYYSGELANEAKGVKSAERTEGSEGSEGMVDDVVKPTLLMTRSLLFILALVPMSLYILTSTGSSLGVGVLLGIIVGLAIEMVVLAANLNALRDRFLSQLKRPISSQDISWFVRLYLVFAIIISALVIF